MENPDAYRAGKDLVEFEWRQNHRNYYSSFSLKFYQENDMPLLTLVGKPSAINPDIWLRVRALQRGWPVIDFRRRSRISKALQKAKARRRGFNLVGLGHRF